MVVKTMARMRNSILGTCLALWSSIAVAQEPCLPLTDCVTDECGGGSVAELSCFEEFCSRDTLTGDWLGARTSLAEKGISFQADLTQFYMGNTTGGIDQEFRYAGHGDYVTMLDMDKLAGLKGMFVKLRAEHRFGESLAGATGSWLPPNLLAGLPVSNSEELFLTNVLFTQFLSEEFAVFAGKMDTLDGDTNAFAHGRGKTQFSNLGFVINPILLRSVPYSTLAAGFVYLYESKPLLTFSVLNATDTTTTAGFDQLFQNGVTLATELDLPTTFFDMPGHQTFGGAWSSREYVSLDQDPRIILPNVPVNRETGTWGLYWNFDQYLYTYADDPTLGWGLFGRAGIGDESTNPLSWFLSFGVGGHSPIRSRHADSFGVGWYYFDTSNDLEATFAPLVGSLQAGQGVELYYDIAVTKWCHVTPDMQVLTSPQENLDTSLVVGVRTNLSF